MKKFFTLIAVVCMAMTASAKYQLSLEDLTNGWGSSYDPATKTITFEEGAWGGRGWNLSAETPFDYAAEGYQYVVIKASASDIATKVIVQYTDGTTDDTGAYVQVGADETAFDAGTKLMAARFSVENQKLIQIYIQNSAWSAELKGNPGGTVVLEDAFLCTEEEYQEVLAGNVETEKEISLEGWGWGWSSEQSYADGVLTATVTANGGAVSIGWTEGVDWSAFDYLVAVIDSYESDMTEDAYIAIQANAVGNVPVCTGGVSGTFAEPQTVVCPLDKEKATNVSQLWIQSQVGVFKVRRVYLTTEAPAVDAINAIKTEKTNNSAMYNLAGQQVGKNYKGIVIQNGKKFVNK